VDYFETSGELVERYICESIAIRPLGTIEIFVSTGDTRGGSGANFVVDWSAGPTISDPLIEAVMVGSLGTNGFSLVSRGQPIVSVRSDAR
jgi:hypothetical protein